MINNIEKNDTLGLLKNLSNLHGYNGDEKEFWEYFLKNILYLSKSPFLYKISKEDESFFLEKEIYENEEFKDLNEDIIKISLSLTKRAEENIYAFEKFAISSLINGFLVLVKLNTLDTQSYISFFVDSKNKIEFSNIILRMCLIRDIPNTLGLNKTSQKSLEPIENSINENRFLINTLEVFETILEENRFELACRKIVDDLANRFNCEKVSLGWQKADYIKPIAINQIEHFEKSSHIINALEAVFEESYEQDEEIFYPLDEESTLVTSAHKIYHKDYRCDYIYTFPLRVNDESIGIITFESKTEIDEKILENIRLILNYATVILNDIYKKDMNIFKKSFYSLKNTSKKIFEPRDSLKKLLIVLLSIIILVLAFGKMEYKVEAVTNLQTDNISYLSTPYDAIVKNVYKDLGDDVKKDDLLLDFDTEELTFKLLEINSEIIKYSREVEKARANRSLADMKIAEAKKEQAKTSYQKIEYYLSQSKIFAPFDGIIVEGEKEELLGKPSSKGDILLQIAKPSNLYAKIKVEEEFIDEIKVNQKAELSLLSRPDETFNVKIKKIIPMAKIDEKSGNIFEIVVEFESKTSDWMRPGMSGIAKVKVGDRNIFWVLTHKISDFLHLYLWW